MYIVPNVPSGRRYGKIQCLPGSGFEQRNDASACGVLAAAMVQVAFLYIWPILVISDLLSWSSSWRIHKASTQRYR